MDKDTWVFGNDKRMECEGEFYTFLYFRIRPRQERVNVMYFAVSL